MGFLICEQKGSFFLPRGTGIKYRAFPRALSRALPRVLSKPSKGFGACRCPSKDEDLGYSSPLRKYVVFLCIRNCPLRKYLVIFMSKNLLAGSKGSRG